MSRPKCILTVDVEALPLRAPGHHVDTLIYGCIDGEEWGIGRIMDIADYHGVKMTFFLDFAEAELYGDAITEVGKYIVSRGHDLQIHCHYDLLATKIFERFPQAGQNYHTWYEDEDISDFIVDYCLEQYHKCTTKEPIVFRGGEYRFGAALLRKLKEKGIAADASYNYLRPRQRPVNRQFVYENGLLELPVGILPEHGREPKRILNFNKRDVYPACAGDIEVALKRYELLFRDFYASYGDSALASFLMHGWSFCFHEDRFQKTGYIDRPNPFAPELFDRLLGMLYEKVDFITAAEAVRLSDDYFIKKVDFDSIFSLYQTQNTDNLKLVEAFVRRKAGDREVVIWGTGMLERQAHDAWNISARLNTSFYVSSRSISTWRGKPVKTFETACLSPNRHYVLLLVKPCIPEVRESLINSGFTEFEDYFDVNKQVPREGGALLHPPKDICCPICDGKEFELFNPERHIELPRRCAKCGSVERSRTIPKLFFEDLGKELLSQKILHISPIRSERLFFKQAGASYVTTLDVRPQVKPDIIADLCNMPQVESDAFDIVFANCVLNHVYDDEAALSEVHRVLRDKGLFIVWVMGSGTLKTKADSNPTAWYGEDAMETYRVGTYRYYGETDFTAQLRRHFSKVRSYEKFDAVTEQSCCWYVCEK